MSIERFYERIREAIRSQYGDFGRLVIRGTKIDVPLFDADGKDAQKVVDAEKSAVAMNWLGKIVIADHNYQDNFSNLGRVSTGDTAAFYRGMENKEELLCVRKEVGRIDKDRHLKDKDGKSVFWQDFYVCIYTCLGKKGDDTEVILTFWDREE